MTALVTGASGGLGRRMRERIGAQGLCRENANDFFAGRERFDLVVHCAHSRKKDVTQFGLAEYLEDSVELTKKTLALCEGTYVLASSISVYPLDGHSLNEDDPILLDVVPTFYGVAKLMSEAAAREWARKTSGRLIILRLSSLLGAYSPPNVTMRILSGAADEVPLTATSLFNYLTHDEVCDFTVQAIEDRAEGVFNLAAGDSVALERVAALANRTIRFGAIHYAAPTPPIDRAAARFPSLRRPSEARIQHAIKRIAAEPPQPPPPL
ncbi:MAG: NAD-dependent epimerase/dehydratase family protein [Pseudomonadota bacterium]